MFSNKIIIFKTKTGYTSQLSFIPLCLLQKKNIILDSKNVTSEINFNFVLLATYIFIPSNNKM